MGTNIFFILLQTYHQTDQIPPDVPNMINIVSSH